MGGVIVGPGGREDDGGRLWVVIVGDVSEGAGGIVEDGGMV